MKNLFTIILTLFFQSIAFSQNLPQLEGKIIFKKIFEKEQISKDRLFLLSKQFFVDSFKNSNYVIKSEDKEAGQIIGKGFADMSYFRGNSIIGTVYPMYFTIQTDVKEGKARIRIYDAYYDNPKAHRKATLEQENDKKRKGIDKSDKNREKYEDWCKFMNSQFNAIIELYEKKINDKSNADDNW